MSVFFLLAALVVLVCVLHVVGDEIELSIDCGLDDKVGSYTDTDTDLLYVADGTHVDAAAGENHVVAAAADQAKNGRVDAIQSLRSFPSGKWNCYTLPTPARGATYLVRMQFLYGNYDNKGSSSVEFEIHLGSVPWDIVTVGLNDTVTKEAVFVAWAGWVPVCLVNTDRGTPFVSVVELRKLGDGLYPPVSGNQSMSMYDRRMMGIDDALVTRHPSDTHDRFWYGKSGPQWRNMSTQQYIQADPSFDVPSPILQTAVEPAGNNSMSLTVIAGQDYRNTYRFMAFLHFADFGSDNNTTQAREFDIYVNNNLLTVSKPYSPGYLSGSCVHSPDWYSAPDGRHNITLVGTAASTLRPPMLNALEIYTLIDMDDVPAPPTMPDDFDAIMGIKLKYVVKRKWTGDPCLPDTLWNGLTCTILPDLNLSRITALDLSNSNLSGEISSNFTLLTALRTLDLSYNNLNGPIPDFLSNLPSLQVLNLSGNHLSGPLPESFCKNMTGLLVFSYDGQVLAALCAQRTNPSRKNTIVKAVSIGVSVLVVAILVLGYFIWRKKIHSNESTQDDHARDQELENNTPRSAKGHAGNLQNSENRQFTYKELEKITNNFEGFIGHGGFGRVYYGRLERGTEVAVKMRSESSLHGLDEFLAEVQSLTKVHHRNLVSLIGYCWEGDHLALIYEYLSQGSLFDHLRGNKNRVAETLNWGTRVRVVLEAAQGLDYLHKGCNPPIIHRDVKTSNILLGRNLEAKLADFGLSKAYLSDSQTHISATAAGTSGYIDPEHYHTGRLTESSDVYSFGVVLLEVATGKAPILPGHGHIVQRVNQMITAGEDISRIADARLEGAYDVNSMWKVVDTANQCTSDAAAQRPTMATVVAQLKESLALEEARESDSSVRATLGGDVSALLSAGGPSAR